MPFSWKQPFHYWRRLLAKYWLKLNPQLTVIGITGSYGKTNTTRAIKTVLSEKYKVLQSDLNLDTIYNLPMTILKLRPYHQKLVLEYGVDHINEMDYHLSLVKPSIAVVTGINPTHSDSELLGSISGIINEKQKLIQALPIDGWAVVNWDDDNVRMMIDQTKAKIIKYGFENNLDFWADNIKISLSKTSFIGHHKKDQYYYTTGLIGKHFVLDCLAAIAVGHLQGLTWSEIAQGLKSLKPLKGRFSLEKGPLGTILINDSLRANPASTIAGLETLAILPTKGRRIAVLGEMGELGNLDMSEHRRVGQRIAQLEIDFLISVGPLQKYTADQVIRLGMKKNRVFWVKDVQQAAIVLKSILKTGDLFYLKGSLLRHMERIIILLENKSVSCRKVVCHRYQSCKTCPNIILSE